MPDPARVSEPTVGEPVVSEPAAAIARVPEAAVQDAWVRGLFDASALRTTDGLAVQVVERGRLNRDSGPDVVGARVVIDGVLWAGDVEVHVASGAWETHRHQDDPAYNRVVLHVVLSADARTGTLRRADRSALPELVLLPHLDRSLRALLRAFYVEPHHAPHCSDSWGAVDEALRRDWLRRLGAERLWDRARALGRAYGRRPDLDRLLVGRAFRALGYEANADAFETLAGRLPLASLRQSDGPAVHQAILAASGLVSSDLFRATPGGPAPMRPEAWKRGGRPANAPLRRVAQAAAWLAPNGPFRTDPIATLADAVSRGRRAALDVLRPETPDGSGRLGEARAARVLVDAVLPVLLLDAEQREAPEGEAAAFDVFAGLPAPSDRILRRFTEAGLRPRSAAESHGAHHLARAYCDEGRCARCEIGLALFPGLARQV